MREAKEIYPEKWESEQKDGRFYGPGDYQPIIEEFGNILIQVDDRDYQGDSRILYESYGRYGYLIFGWGSCSGCDSLQRCETIQEIQELMNSLQNDVQWFDSMEELGNHFIERDWALQYSWHAEETKEFINKVLEYVEENKK